MPSKLEDLRLMLDGKQQRYPTAYHLAILDGSYDVRAIEQAMVQDISAFIRGTTVLSPPKTVMPKKKTDKPVAPLLLTMEDITKNKELDEAIREEAMKKGKKLARNPGLGSANKAIQYIQNCGRNSLQAQSLVDGMTVEY